MDGDRLCSELVAGTRYAVFIADRDGRIRFWNQGVTDVFGYPEADALGESLDLIIPKQFRNRHWAGYHAALERGSTVYERGECLSVPVVRMDGAGISVDFTVTVIRDETDTIAEGRSDAP